MDLSGFANELFNCRTRDNLLKRTSAGKSCTFRVDKTKSNSSNKNSRAKPEQNR